MSRRAAVVEEFDDDTDIPLPSRPLPNTGTRGAIIQEIGDSDGDGDGASDDEDDGPGPASPSSQAAAFMKAQAQPKQAQSMDLTPYKTWAMVYPIYIDAKRPYGTGTRRISREKSVWWPLSKDIADATQRLGLRALHEVDKSHPRDWENPGRVRVQWKKDGKAVNNRITSKKLLLEAIAEHIQRAKPDIVPREPYNYAPRTQASAPPTTAGSKSKGKQVAGKPAAPATTPAPATGPQKPNGHAPQPPEPLPSLSVRVSAYSPVVPTGMLLDTIKAGMSAAANQEQGGAPGLPGAPGGAAAGMKGKRKVVRVRQ